MTLRALKLSNFKGIKALDLQLSEYGNVISGANATGKSTVFDAFCWLLFGKDSHDRMKFNVKTLDENGEPIHNLTHTVTGVFAVDGQDLTLERRYYEVWSRKRGDAQQHLTSHTTDFFINGAPATAAEYTARVDAIVGSTDLFKILTNVCFFSESLHWKERRKMLFDLAGDIGADSKIMSLKAFAPLKDLLTNKTLDELRRELAAKAKETRDELERIPVRIDEIMRRMPATDPTARSTKEALAKQKADLEKEAAGIAEQIKSARAAVNAEIAAQRQAMEEVARLENALTRRRLEIERAQAFEEAKARTERDAAEARIVLAEQSQQNTKEQVKQYAARISEAGTKLLELQAQRDEEAARTYTIRPEETTCPTCGQDLPAAMLTAKTDEVKAKFEQRKAITLRSLDASIALASKDLDTANKSLEQFQTQNKDAAARIEAIKAEAAAAREAYERVASASPALNADKEYQRIQKALAAARAALPPEQEDKPADSSLAHRWEELSEQIAALTRAIVEQENADAAQARIRELEDEQTRLSDELARVEKLQFLCDDYTLRWAKLTEKTINSLFKTVSFVLFRPQVNGGVEECCEAVIDGVPYSDANTAARINAGLEIIDTISRHYNVQAPIFIDNAEAVLHLAPVPLQIIELRVSNEPALHITERL
jgi:DNA repair exonuclease SbcCD ATPase subunit